MTGTTRTTNPRRGAWRVAGGVAAVALGIWAAGAWNRPGAAAGSLTSGGQAPPAAKVAGPSGEHPAPSFQLRSEASFEERRNPRGGWDRTVVEPRYAVVHVERPPARGVEMLLAQRLVSTSHSDAEASESQLAVTGWIGAKARYDEKAWAFTAAADDGAIEAGHDLFMATKYGCCGAEDVHDWFSLRTGRLAATSTAKGVAFVAIPNTPTTRIVAYHGANGEHPPATAHPIPQLLGVLTLGGHDGPIHRVAAVAAGIDAWTPELRLEIAGKAEATTDLDLWGADKNPSPRGIRGFRIKLVYEDRPPVIIPVEGDDFDLAHAVVPAPFHLQRLDDHPAAAR